MSIGTPPPKYFATISTAPIGPRNVVSTPIRSRRGLRIEGEVVRFFWDYGVRFPSEG